MSGVKTDVLYYGDNLEILRKYVPDASVDLVYLDPPFNSNRDYNVIFRDESGRKSDAQLLAFEDTWHWGPDAEAQYAYLTNTARNGGRVPSTVSTIVAALRSGIGENQMMAYLVEMAVRLVELHRVLKPTGSLYLHCDPHDRRAPGGASPGGPAAPCPAHVPACRAGREEGRGTGGPVRGVILRCASPSCPGLSRVRGLGACACQRRHSKVVRAVTGTQGAD
jgi:hypothetical protein